MHSKFPGSATSDSGLNAETNEKYNIIWSIALFERAIQQTVPSVAGRCLATTYLFMCPPFYLYVLTTHAASSYGPRSIWQLYFCIAHEAQYTKRNSNNNKKWLIK